MKVPTTAVKKNLILLADEVLLDLVLMLNLRNGVHCLGSRIYMMVTKRVHRLPADHAYTKTTADRLR